MFKDNMDLSSTALQNVSMFLCSSFSKVGVAMADYFHHNAKTSDVKGNQLQS